jgi:hypothetical protein
MRCRRDLTLSNAAAAIPGLTGLVDTLAPHIGAVQRSSAQLQQPTSPETYQALTATLAAEIAQLDQLLTAA